MATFKGIKLNGVDVSSYQSGIDFTKVDCDFVVVKATQGTWYTNPCFESQFESARKAGKLLGIYHYSEGKNAEKEAVYFVEKCGWRVGNAVLFLDWEGNANPTFCSGNDVAFCKKFCDKVKELTGQPCIPYMSKGICTKYDWSGVGNGMCWVAQYKKVPPTSFTNTPWTDEHGFGAFECVILQYSSQGQLDGYKGRLDLNGSTLTKDQWKALSKTAEKVEMPEGRIIVKIDPQKAMENLAMAEMNYVEKASNKDLYHKTTNAGKNNWTKYGIEMHKLLPSVMDVPAPWCDCWYDWLCQRLFGTSTAKSLLGGNFDDYTVASANMYIKHNAWVTHDFQLGDQIFFSANDEKVSGIYHTGMFIKYQGNRTFVAEGNTSTARGVVANGGGVCLKDYPRTPNAIVGAGRPKWDLCGTLTHEFVCPAELKQGMKGITVRLWQTICGADVDGSFGPKTASSTIAWKKAHGLPQTAVVEQETWSKALSDYVVTYGMPDIEFLSKGRCVKVLQAAIGAETDGSFGSDTRRKTIAFQKKHGLDATGYVSEKTWDAVFTALADNR